MSATFEATREMDQEVRRSREASLGTRIRVRLQHHRIDGELARGADPNTDPLRYERARELVGDESRRRLGSGLERLVAAADAEPIRFSSRVPIARMAIRDSLPDMENIIERLHAPAYLSPQGVAMVAVLLADGAGPLYGSATAPAGELHRALETVVHAIDNGPVMIV
jgi:hypothetical protein